MTIITAAGTKNKANEERETPGFGRFPCERARAPRARRYILFLFRSRPSPKIGVRHKKEANAFHFSRLSVELVEGFVVIFHCAAVGRTLARCHRSGTIQC